MRPPKNSEPRADESGADPLVGYSPDSSTLTEREREIGYRVARGYTNREIAGDLFISPKTVEKHIARIFAKLGTSSRAGVAAAMGRSAASDGAPGLRLVHHPYDDGPPQSPLVPIDVPP
ncbi:response regulator transcription factor [Nocardia fusca]|uniref:response regulator transcription factor n=1 Tax=Nocardia fusca TaxID=941183 RepID=UPI0037C86307